MKIQIVSDLHLEFTKFECELDPVTSAERDLLIVAGDTAEGMRGQYWLRDEAEKHGCPVVQVLGNHEYYGWDIDDIDKAWAEHDHPLIHTLQCAVFEHEGLRIAGCTLWTGFRGLDGYHTRMIEQKIIDFTVIKKRGARFSAMICQGIHLQHKTWLMQQKDIDIVVTHHAPSYQSVTPYWREKGSMLTPAFYTDIDDVIEQLKPKFWIHGHMHSFMRYWHNRDKDTQVICNPRGYVRGGDQEQWGFRTNLMIEI